MLFYFAGYEIDFERIKGMPLRLGARGWLLSVALAYAIGGLLVALGVIDSLIYTGSAMAKLVMFFCLFLVVRGAPALLLYRDVLGSTQRASLAFYSATELPLVVAITTLAVEDGHMKASTAAGLVGAAMLSTLVFPFVGTALQNRHASAGLKAPVPAEG